MNAQPAPGGTIAGVRQTINSGAYVSVSQENNPFYHQARPPTNAPSTKNDLRNYYQDVDTLQAFSFSGFCTIMGGTAYMYKRNCHDFAWGPWMLDGPPIIGATYAQHEAWWMGEPNDATSWPYKNWQAADGSFKVGAIGTKDTNGEYTFSLASLQGFIGNYINSTATPFAPAPPFYSLPSPPNALTAAFRPIIPLPVCPLTNSVPMASTEWPVHSALLIGWIPTADNSNAHGVFVSKWGNMGVYVHRWGVTYCDSTYCNASNIYVFVPWKGWGSPPPYNIVVTPW